MNRSRIIPVAGLALALTLGAGCELPTTVQRPRTPLGGGQSGRECHDDETAIAGYCWSENTLRQGLVELGELPDENGDYR